MEGFAVFLLELPPQIKAAIALGVLYLVRLALSGSVPDEFLTEIAGIITTAVVASIELALGLIPPNFEGVAAAILSLIAVLLGGIVVVNGWRLLKAALIGHGLRP